MRLYHFLSANFALDDIEKRRIKISEIDQLNDPFELWCVPQDDQRLREALRGFKKEMGERYGMLCFRTGGQDANPMMASDAQPSGFEGGLFDLPFFALVLRHPQGRRVWALRGAPTITEVESGRLALPNVLPAGARNRLRGMFLCHRLPADGTILTPHGGSAFSSTKRCNAGGHVKLTDHCVEFFPEKRERFSVGCNRSG